MTEITQSHTPDITYPLFLNCQRISVTSLSETLLQKQQPIIHLRARKPYDRNIDFDIWVNWVGSQFYLETTKPPKYYPYACFAELEILAMWLATHAYEIVQICSENEVLYEYTNPK